MQNDTHNNSRNNFRRSSSAEDVAGKFSERSLAYHYLPSPPLDNIWVMLIVWRLRSNIIRTVLCWIVWHNVHSPQHTYMSSYYRSNILGLLYRDPYAVRRGGCLELYCCNMVDWFWWDSSLISTTNWFASVLWHCWFSHLACKNRPWNDLLCVEWDVKPLHYYYLARRWLTTSRHERLYSDRFHSGYGWPLMFVDRGDARTFCASLSGSVVMFTVPVVNFPSGIRVGAQVWYDFSAFRAW